MQHLVVSLILAFCLICSAVGEAAYLIKLKNGNEFVTGRYWHEGRQIMFDIYGGVFGVDRTFVAKIEESNKALKLEARIQDLPEEKPQAASAKEEKEQKKAPASADSKTQVNREDDPILKEFDALKERSKGVNGMLTSEIRELLGEITAFKKKISTNSKFLIDYSREYNEVHEVSAAVEAALRSRNQ